MKHVVLQRNQQLDGSGRAADLQTLLADLRACTRTKNLQKGRQVHAQAVECGYGSSDYVASAVIKMYAKCGSMTDARQVFDTMKNPDVVSWTVLILGYADNGQGHTALDLFTKMRSAGLAPDSVALLGALKACISIALQGGSAECGTWGREIHRLAVEKNCVENIYVQNTLLDMYTKCDSMVEARKVFDSMKHPTVVSWTTLILGYAESGEGRTGLDLFMKMKTEGPAPNCITLVGGLKACTSLALNGGPGGIAECKERGKEFHTMAVDNGWESNTYIRNTLIDMYSKCGSMVDARQVFDSMQLPNLVSWTAMILGYADNGQGTKALEMFARMKTKGLVPDSVTFFSVLKGCYSQEDYGLVDSRNRGKQLHNLAVDNDCDSDIYVQNTLISMYAKYGCMVDARQVFDSMKQRGGLSWTALILGYADCGESVKALEMFTRMKDEGHAPDAITYSGALKACALLGALEFGRTVHSEINSGDHLDVVLVTCLVNFYAKCGSLVEAQSIFDSHGGASEVITWNALLAGFSNCGDNESMLALLQGLQDAGFNPDGITFLHILSCCSHAGLLEEAEKWFHSMATKYRVPRTVKHYTCMADVFGRANKLDDAMALLHSMACSPDDITWMTILGACRKWKNVELGRLAFQSLVEFNDSCYFLMGQIYGSRGMLREQELVMGMRKKLRAWRTPGETCWTSDNGEVHTFMAAAPS